MNRSLKQLPLFLILSVLHVPSNAQHFRNLNFNQRCDTSKTGLCYWDLSWGGKGSVQPDVINEHHGLRISGKTETNVGFAEQQVHVQPLKEIAVLTVSCDIRSDSIVGKGAGLNIGIYDAEGTLVATKDMGGYYSLDWIQGTSAWKRYSISIVCPLESASVKIGAILFGKGTAWFKDYEVTWTPIDHRKPSELALQYIEAVCDTIRMHALVRDSFNIAIQKEMALKIAGNAQTYRDCYLAVQYLLSALRPLGDEHSFFMSPEEVKNWEDEGSLVSEIQDPVFRRTDDCGYVLVPAFHGGNQKRMLAFADTLQAAIRRLYASGIKGWIVDLRENSGGNMAPMIAGLGPLFSVNKLGSLIDVNGNSESWYYEHGNYHWDNDSGWAVSNPVVLPKRLPIAVLTGNQTGSSGEAVVVSFIGNENTKSFGQPTWGLTTGNGSFQLKDGSQIFLASTIMADRNGNRYHTDIHPEVLVEQSDKTTGDLALQKAIEWIKKKTQ